MFLVTDSSVSEVEVPFVLQEDQNRTYLLRVSILFFVSWIFVFLDNQCFLCTRLLHRERPSPSCYLAAVTFLSVSLNFRKFFEIRLNSKGDDYETTKLMESQFYLVNLLFSKKSLFFWKFIRCRSCPTCGRSFW